MLAMLVNVHGGHAVELESDPEREASRIVAATLTRCVGSFVAIVQRASIHRGRTRRYFDFSLPANN